MRICSLPVNCLRDAYRGQLNRAVGAALVVALVAGCVTTPTPKESVRDETFVPNWQVIAVLPFTGDVAISRPAGEWFANQLQAQKRFRIISPGLAEARLALKNDPNDLQQVARLLGAQAIITGHIDFRGRRTYPELAVKLMDISGLQEVARVSLSPEQTFNWSHAPYDLARVSVDAAAKHMLMSLESLAKATR